MEFNILTEPSQTDPYIEKVQSFADDNKKALGFLPKSAFRDQANNGRLWVAVCKEKGACEGYLMFGGRLPTLKITQLFVSDKYRKHQIASTLLSKLEAYAEEKSYLTINARVAADLESNKFWEKSGYKIIKQAEGGKTTNRIINLRIKELDTPSLFKLMSFKSCVDQKGLKSLKTMQRPLFRSSTYVIDLNVFFDLIKKRVDYNNATRLISSGLRNEIKIYVTPEFCQELERNKTKEHDPIFEFAKQLPTLPRINDNEINKLIKELKTVVFPERENAEDPSSRNRSDLTHLAYCVHHGASGFITREKAILSAGDQLKESYHLEILTAADLSQPTVEKLPKIHSLSVDHQKGKLTVSAFKEDQRELAEMFLMSFQVKKEYIPEILHPGTSSSPRIRMVASVGNRVVGIASWDNSKDLRREKLLYLYVDENSSQPELIIDHFLEASIRDSALLHPVVVALKIGPEQPKTVATALQCGFLPMSGDDDRSPRKELLKFIYNEPISKGSWNNFKEKFEELTDFKLPERIPTLSEFDNTGIRIKTGSGKYGCIDLFEFETLVSPAIVLCPGRDALIVPIRKKYAQNFFTLPHTQLDLFSSPEALFHIEKAYFRSYRSASIFERGKLVLFYISGSDGGSMEIIGCGRITYSEVISVDKASLLLERQGVLSREELSGIANKYNLIHAFTFDNYSRFQAKIPFAQLKSNKLISDANLVTAERLSPKKLNKICKMGFNN